MSTMPHASLDGSEITRPPAPGVRRTRHKPVATRATQPPTDDPRVLVVVTHPAATDALVEAVRDRREAGPATFHVLVPNPDDQLVVDRASQDVHVGAHRLAVVLARLEDEVGLEVEGRASPSPSAYDDILDELDAQAYDEIIVAASPTHASHRLHRDLPGRISDLGYTVTAVAAHPERRIASAKA